MLTVLFGVNYLVWRIFFSLNLDAWWIAIPLVIAEAYSIIDVALFSMTMWRSRNRPRPPTPVEGLTVDVFITTYNEPVDLVMATAIAARDIRYPHETWVLDDGARDEMRLAAAAAGVGYITRGDDWTNRPLHAKAGNLNNALMATHGEFMLILDADQIPDARILDHTLGYFTDPLVALVQTPQQFGNVPDDDPLGSQAPLFYGPIQQGKDGWNAAFFCGSNALLRRDALMQLGVMKYVIEVERAVRISLKGASKVMKKAIAAEGSRNPVLLHALIEVDDAIKRAHHEIATGASITGATYDLHRSISQVSRSLVEADLKLMAADLAALNVRPADDYPRASEWIASMITLIARLVDAGNAYVGEDGTVYFDAQSFDGYGSLSGNRLEDLRAGRAAPPRPRPPGPAPSTSKCRARAPARR